MIIDLIVVFALAKMAVMLCEDGFAAVRGRRSPRLEARDRIAAGQARAGGLRRAGDAAGGYVAGLVEDGFARARASRRRRRARRAARRAVDGVFIQFFDDGWYADCDVCGWSSRSYRVEANADAAGRDHVRTAHPKGEGDAAGGEPERPRLTVIPGGAAADPPDPGDPDGSSGPVASGPVVRTGDHTYCQGCPQCQPRVWGWRCGTCGESDSGYLTEDAAHDACAAHRCTAKSDRVSGDTDQADTTEPAGGTVPTGDNPKEGFSMNLEATGPEEIRAAFAATHETLSNHAEEIGSVAAILTEGVDRFESLGMAPSTIAILRDAIDSLATIESDLGEAAEQVNAAKVDFDASDGAVAEAVVDAGNLADKEVLVG